MSFHLPFNSFQCVLSAYKSDLLSPGTRPLVSMSGGQDSIFLAWATFLLQHDKNLAPQSLYHNHLWHVQGLFHGVHCLRLASVFGWPFLYTLPFRAVFDEGRAWSFRQHLRERLASFYDTTDVFVGHTKTDRIESFLFHFLRGSLHPNALFPDQRHFAPPLTEAVKIESSPSTLFAFERSALVFEAPVFLPSAYHRFRDDLSIRTML